MIEKGARISDFASNLNRDISIHEGLPVALLDVCRREIRPETGSVYLGIFDELRLSVSLPWVTGNALVVVIHHEGISAEVNAELIGLQHVAAWN